MSERLRVMKLGLLHWEKCLKELSSMQHEADEEKLLGAPSPKVCGTIWSVASVEEWG